MIATPVPMKVSLSAVVTPQWYLQNSLYATTRPTRMHRPRTNGRWSPEMLSDLWAEQHPRSPRQLQLPAAFLR